MPRTFVAKGVLTTDRTALEEAFKYRVDTGCSIRTACKEFGVKPTTLQEAFKRSKKVSDGRTFVPIQQNINRVFTDEQEQHLEEYAIKIDQMFYGLPVREFRKLVLSYAEDCGSKAIPDAWVTQGMATRDWYYAYISRHPNLVLKAPEGMSIARTMAFNHTNIEVFFKSYTEAIAHHQFTPDRIYNMDESGLSTVMKPVKVVCQQGYPVAPQVSQERGAHMTFVGFINAAGHYIPPVFIVALKRMNLDFLEGTIHGTSVLLHHNGWMTHEGFLDTLKHLHKNTYCSLDNKVLLIMDNAECHMSIHAVEYAIQHGIVIVTLPPHTTAKLQPLEVSIFGPFKSFLQVLHNDFKLTNPNIAITEHMLPEMACEAWIKACTPDNVLSGFAATGIWPINRNIFPDESFAGAEVSELESAQAIVRDVSPSDSEELQTLDQVLLTLSSSGCISPDYPAAGPSSIVNLPPAPLPRPEPAPVPASGPSSVPGPAPVPGPSPGPVRVSSTSLGASITPEAIRPYPRGPARKASRVRKKIKACILTEYPDALEQLRRKEEKKLEKIEKKRQQLDKKREKQGKKDSSKKRKSVNVGPSDESSEEEGSDSLRKLLSLLDDSSDFSEDLTEELEGSAYPYVEKEPEVDGNQDHAGTLVRAESSSYTPTPSISHKRKQDKVDFHMQDDDDDECDGFGKFVAGKLKKMSRIQREFAEKQVLELLCNRSMHTSSTSFSKSNANKCDDDMERPSLSLVKSELDEVFIKTEEDDTHEVYFETEDHDPCQV